ncbi:Putative HeH/LEM domain-containing protein [Colletotrichum destructivum]|uniref:HeH/LEM domain-containing protein n=1 Tax=Colletotrichum destructivum TaxID=34406 RepID=A0AAX4IX73_9PEZI|nr:Putative HeH/LEM domain-containing protein [Colletotrichum destructivum]
MDNDPPSGSETESIIVARKASNRNSSAAKALKNIPSIEDDVSYLQPDFDPNSLPVPKLRNIFLAHDVAYRSAKTKAELVDLFVREVAPRAAATLEAMTRVKRSDRGIVDVGR